MADALVDAVASSQCQIRLAYDRTGVPNARRGQLSISDYVQIGRKFPQKQWLVGAKRHIFDADSGKRLNFR
jgi:hypothetical protein